MRASSLALACVGSLALVASADAAITVRNHWTMGDADAGAVGATLADHTNASVGTWHLYTQPWPSPAPLSTYSADVPDASKLPAAGASAKSIALDGTDHFQYWANDWRYVDNWGMEAWVKPTALNTTQIVVYAGLPSTSGGIGMILANNQVRIHFGGKGSVTWDAPGLAADTWTHLAMVRDSGVTSLYVNGINVSPATAHTLEPLAPTAAIGVGSYSYGGGSYFNGKLDNIRLFTFTGGEFASSDLLVVVPEPTSLALIGLAGVCLMHRARRQ